MKQDIEDDIISLDNMIQDLIDKMIKERRAAPW